MTNNKNFKFLSLTNVTYIEKYIKELLNICFEYSSIFTFSYNLNSFKNMCLYNINTSLKNMSNLIYLINIYLEKDCFYSSLFSLVNFKAKLTSKQVFQSLNIKGVYSDNNTNSIFLLSNLYYGLSLKDLIYSSFSARKSIIDSSLNTSESGYLTRKLVESLRDVSLKSYKCFSKYTYKNIFFNKYLSLPFLCSSNKSVCLKCLHIDSKNFTISGYSKGVISGQALGEPSTQMLLRTFHLGDRLTFKNLLCSSKIYNRCIDKIYKTNSYRYCWVYNYKHISVYNNLLYLNSIYKYNIKNIEICQYIDLLSSVLIKILNNLWVYINLFNTISYNSCFNLFKKTVNNYLLF